MFTVDNILEQDYATRYEYANNYRTPPEILDVLSKDKDVYIKCYVARNINSSSETLSYLLKESMGVIGMSDICAKIAQNPNAPNDLLELLSFHTTDYVRTALASNKNISSKLLIDLSKDTNHYTRLAVAYNDNTSVTTLEFLSNDNEEIVRAAVSTNKNVSSKILTKLAKDDNYYVRKTVAQNPNTPIKMLRLLIKDEYKLVRDIAIETLSYFEF